MSKMKIGQIIIWATVIIIVLLLGLHTEAGKVLNAGEGWLESSMPPSLYWYGVSIGTGTIGYYKYPLCLSVLLIGFAVFMTLKKK